MGPEILLVALGGALGGVARHVLSGLVDGRTGKSFPWGTLAVNASGALALGLLAGALLGPGAPAPDSLPWAFLAVGALGSYTTVSSFSLQTLALLEGGRPTAAGWNVLLSFGLCLLAAGLGLMGGSAIAGLGGSG